IQIPFAGSFAHSHNFLSISRSVFRLPEPPVSWPARIRHCPFAEADSIIARTSSKSLLAILLPVRAARSQYHGSTGASLNQSRPVRNISDIKGTKLCAFEPFPIVV